MSGWKLFLIVTAVVVFHLGFFALLSERAVLPDRPRIPAPNFFSREREVVDEATGEKYIHREISVSTKLKDLGPRPEPRTTPTFVPTL